jgi:hypothetical protein
MRSLFTWTLPIHKLTYDSIKPKKIEHGKRPLLWSVSSASTDPNMQFQLEPKADMQVASLYVSLLELVAGNEVARACSLTIATQAGANVGLVQEPQGAIYSGGGNAGLNGILIYQFDRSSGPFPVNFVFKQGIIYEFTAVNTEAITLGAQLRIVANIEYFSI